MRSLWILDAWNGSMVIKELPSSWKVTLIIEVNGILTEEMYGGETIYNEGLSVLGEWRDLLEAELK